MQRNCLVGHSGPTARSNKRIQARVDTPTWWSRETVWNELEVKKKKKKKAREVKARKGDDLVSRYPLESQRG